ncbi:MAG: hypothetical protein JSV13_01520, partial [Nitrospiraceae bacterium]
MKYIGLDAGSVSVKAVVLDEKGNNLERHYLRHKGHPLNVALDMLKSIVTLQGTTSENRNYSLSLTGSAGRLLGTVLMIEPVNEVVAYSYATRILFPHVRTIIELGGEDSKLIILEEDSLSAKDFSMNSVCAAGTGSFLDQQAERLRLTIEDFSELSLKSKKPPRIAGRCSVFAKSDMIHLQQIATPVEDITAGLCFAVARNFKGSIARGRQLVPPVSFVGGVAANRGMIRAFKEVFGIDELLVPEEYAVMGALGAALKDRDSGKQHAFDLQQLKDFIHSVKPVEKGYVPLVSEGEDFFERHNGNSSGYQAPGPASLTPTRFSRVKAYLGVDVGSISTNLAVIDEDHNVLAKRYLMTAGRPIEAVKQGLEEIGREVG